MLSLTHHAVGDGAGACLQTEGSVLWTLYFQLGGPWLNTEVQEEGQGPLVLWLAGLSMHLLSTLG